MLDGFFWCKAKLIDRCRVNIWILLTDKDEQTAENTNQEALWDHENLNWVADEDPMFALRYWQFGSVIRDKRFLTKEGNARE